MQKRVRAFAAAAVVTATLMLAACNVAPPTGGPSGPDETSTVETHPVPTSVSCATIESELAYANKLVTSASKGFGEDPYAALDKIRDAIKYIEQLREAATDVRLEDALNDIAFESRELADTLERVMREGTLLTAFHDIADSADRVEEGFNTLLDYCRF
ncbi:hypothetical protein [Gulosibacter bifidus]|uniref:Lipoprotein n=1 Tax=Gulosibacter bifidus TaxID=272239 RepID=A0ABW5RID5_9MICO|nr:hypothetical protein [Gulosibacter bifidus]